MDMRRPDSGATILPPRIIGRCHGKSQFAAVAFLSSLNGQLTAAQVARAMGHMTPARVRYLANKSNIPLRPDGLKRIFKDRKLQRFLERVPDEIVTITFDEADVVLGATMSAAAMVRAGHPRDFGCRWIDGDMKRDFDWKFCGKPRVKAGCSYCATHHALVYQPAKTKEKTDVD